MPVNDLLGNDRAATPVIGIILVVAITVVLAAVVGPFALDLGNESTKSAPQATLAFNYTDGSTTTSSFGNPNGDGLLTIRHESGMSIPAQQLTIEGGPNGEQNVATDSVNAPMYSSGDEVGASDTITYRMDSDDEIRVIWTSADGETTTVIGRYSGPDAS